MANAESSTSSQDTSLQPQTLGDGAPAAPQANSTNNTSSNISVHPLAPGSAFAETEVELDRWFSEQAAQGPQHLVALTTAAGAGPGAGATGTDTTGSVSTQADAQTASAICATTIRASSYSSVHRHDDSLADSTGADPILTTPAGQHIRTSIGSEQPIRAHAISVPSSLDSITLSVRSTLETPAGESGDAADIGGREPAVHRIELPPGDERAGKGDSDGGSGRNAISVQRLRVLGKGEFGVVWEGVCCNVYVGVCVW